MPVVKNNENHTPSGTSLPVMKTGGDGANDWDSKDVSNDWQKGSSRAVNEWDDGGTAAANPESKGFDDEDGGVKLKTEEYDFNADNNDFNASGGAGEFGVGGDDSGAAPGGGGGGGCHNCGQEGHFAKECPEPRKMTCFNCGKDGHAKAECTEPIVFKGTCRICEKEGHPAKECPTRPPMKCNNCQQEGHVAFECTNDRPVDFSGVPDKSDEEAWALMTKADKESDVDDFKEAMAMYVKAVPKTTYTDLSRGMEGNKFKFQLIALEKPIQDTLTIVDLQGKIDRKFVVTVQRSLEPRRKKDAEFWPKNRDENLRRLENAGLPENRGVSKCIRCGELGHTSRGCKQEREEREAVADKCYVCGESGHRARDCTQPRVDRYACRNCGQRGHGSRECPEPRNMDNVECKYCSKMGHFAKECPEKPKETCRNCGEEGHRAKECEKPKVIRCNNCDAEGHVSKECPKPRDYSRVKCRNCGQMGHTVVRCPEPIKEEEGGNEDFGAGGGGFDNPVPDANDAGNFNAEQATGAMGDFEVPPVDSSAPTGDW